MTLHTRTPAHDRVVLEPYQELCGRLEEIETAEESIRIHLSTGTLEFDRESRAAQACISALQDSKGERVGILYVPFSVEPIRMRQS